MILIVKVMYTSVKYNPLLTDFEPRLFESFSWLLTMYRISSLELYSVSVGDTKSS